MWPSKRERPGMDRTKYPTRTVEVESLGVNPGFRVRGVVQKKGDRARLPVPEAMDLVRRLKATIVEGTELTELL